MLLLTGFERFGKNSYNLSHEIVKYFPQKLNKIKIKKLILPVNWDISIKKYKESLKLLKEEVKIVILTGIHTGKRFYIESSAWNFRFGLDENRRYKFGFIKFGKTLRLKSILNMDIFNYYFKTTEQISISSTPSFYLCNYIYFWALFLSKGKYPVVFLHIPMKKSLENSISIVKKICIKLIEKF